MRRLVTMFLPLLLMGAVAACGDDDGGSSAPVDSPQTEVKPDDATDGDSEAGAVDQSPEGLETEEAGTVTIDGSTYLIDRTVACDPEGSPVDAILELVARGQSPAGPVQLDVHLFNFSGSPMHAVDWSGPEGLYSTAVMGSGSSWTSEMDDIYPDPPVSMSPSQVTGSLVLWDMDQETSLNIDFDVANPAELTACR